MLTCKGIFQPMQIITDTYIYIFVMVTFGYSPITIPQQDLKEVGDVIGTHEMTFQGYILDRQNIYCTLYER